MIWLDGGVCTDPATLVSLAQRQQANAIAISSYNGIALGYLEQVMVSLLDAGLGGKPVYIGGKLNQIV